MRLDDGVDGSGGAAADLYFVCSQRWLYRSRRIKTFAFTRQAASPPAPSSNFSLRICIWNLQRWCEVGVFPCSCCCRYCIRSLTGIASTATIFRTVNMIDEWKRQRSNRMWQKKNWIKCYEWMIWMAIGYTRTHTHTHAQYAPYAYMAHGAHTRAIWKIEIEPNHLSTMYIGKINWTGIGLDARIEFILFAGMATVL